MLEPIVYASGFRGGVDAGFAEERKLAACRELDQALAVAPDGVPVEPRLVWGSPAGALFEQAGADVDLLVAGSRSYGALHRAIAGSVSGHLLAAGKVPVLVTPRVVVRAAAAELASVGATA